MARSTTSGTVSRDVNEMLTVRQLCDELKISRRTFERWRALGTAPRYVRLGKGGPIRIKRAWLEDWLDNSEQGVA